MINDSLFSSKRRNVSNANGANASEISTDSQKAARTGTKSPKIPFVAAVSLLALALGNAPIFESPTFAQSIINEIPQKSNRFAGFSTRSPQKVAWLDAADSGTAGTSATVRLDLPAPTRSAKEIAGTRFQIPFRFREGSDRNASDAIELFYSSDRGASWRSFAKVGAADGVSRFDFVAPNAGEYWLTLKTYFKDGRTAFSETRAFRFGGAAATGTTALPLPATGADDSDVDVDLNSSFALNDDSDDEPLANASAVGAFASSSETSGGDYSTRLLALARGENEETTSPKPATAETSAPTAGAVDESQVVPHPGKIKSISVAKDKKTDEMIFVVRWFRPDELEEQYRGKPTTVAIERAASPSGPWTTVVKDLKSEEFGYYWYPGPDEMKPFYLRSVSTDSDGNVWVDPLANPVDVGASGVRDALGKTKSPTADASENSNSNAPKPPTQDEIDGVSAAGSDVSLIRNAAAEDEENESTENLADENGDSGEKSGLFGGSKSAKSTLKAGKRRDADSASAFDDEDEIERGAESSRTSYSPPKPRPNIPAPTNPNEFQINPIFTQGFGVLFQAAQTRSADGSSGGKRSIFTPPNRAAAVAAIPPAEYRSLAAARRRQEEKARDMSTFEKSPELMEGMVFYQDENGNLTRTPPADFQTVSGGGFGADASGAFAGGIQTLGTAPDGSPLLLPSNNETYDSAPNSGAASLTNAVYPNAATPSVSPLNGNYSSATGYGAAPANGAQTPQPQAIPQTSFGVPGAIPSNGGYSSAYPGNYPNGGAAIRPSATRSAFPPRPNVGN